MPQCEKCGWFNETRAQKCSQCGAQFDIESLPPPVPPSKPGSLPAWAPPRPTGVSLTFTGIVFVMLGLLSILVGYHLSSDMEVGPHFAPNRWTFPLEIIGAVAINLGILLWAVGRIINAIWYLPGRE